MSLTAEPQHVGAGAASHVSPKARVRTSAIAGRGLYAGAAISRGEVVAVWGGRVITYQECRALPLPLWELTSQVWLDSFLAPLSVEDEDASSFMNHSCDPNCGVVGSVVLVARRDIAAGEELTYDYGTTEITPYQMACQCGTAACRGRIDGDAWRDAQWRERHAGYLSACVLARVALERTGTLIGTPPGGMPAYLTSHQQETQRDPSR